MSEEEIKKLIWDWETFACEKNELRINEEVLLEYLDEFLNQKKDEDN